MLRIIALVLVALLSLMAGAFARTSDEVICPRVEQAPVLDGVPDEACWKDAALVEGFTAPLSPVAPAKRVAARVCFDGRALYVAFRCAEPKPAGIKALARDGSEDVWKDDCVEVWLRTGQSLLQWDQFIVNAAGARQRARGQAGVAPAGEWRAKARIGKDTWTAELAIPFTALGVPAPTPGTLFQLKLGREDYAGGGQALATWPPRSSYGGVEGYGRLYFETANLLANPDMAQAQDGKPVGWSFGEKDRDLFSSVEDGGRRVIRFAAPDRYAVGQQSLRLKPNSVYRLEARVRGAAGIYLRARTAAQKGGTSTAYSVETKPSAEYRQALVRFPTGNTGDALIIIGNYGGLGRGEVFLADLRVSEEVQCDAEGPAIPLAGGQSVTVSKVPVADCRALRGFVVAPVDGRLNSLNWDMAVWEYNMPGAGAGVGYAYRNNDGLHVTLGDAQGVDAVQIRRGARVKLYAGAERYDDPGKAPLLWRFEGKARNCRALFDKRVKADRFSFFEIEDGLIADVSFLRVGAPAPVGAPAGDALVPVRPGEVPDLAPFLEARFSEQKMLCRLGAGSPAPITAEPGQTIHLVSDPLPVETSLGAVGVRFEAPDAPTGCPLTVAVQDPLNPRAELMGVDCGVEKPGVVAVVLDFPDQVVPAGKRLWLSLTFGARVSLSQVRVEPVRIPRQQAIPQALAYRKLLMRGLFVQLSEARQWGLIRKNTDLERFYKENHWGEGVRELAETIAQCKALGPKDDTVRCYDEWFSRSFRDLPPFEPRIDRVPGAPEWAVLARQAWLQARAVPKYWLDHRLVPTGEFGGEVGDDTDMYQNYADFPMLESDGVGAQVKAAAALLAELAEERLEHGLNRRTMDSLHAYEEGVNHESLMLWWNYGDPVYFERCLAAAKAMPALTTVTEKGHRHFKHDDCGVQDLRVDRPLGWDGGYHPLMLHPCFEVAWYNRSPKVLQLLREYGDAWLDHQQPGDYATAVDVKTEKATATDKRPLRGGGQASAHTFLYDLTRDLKYIRPFMDFYEKGADVWPARDYLPELWHRGALDGVGEKEREAVLRANRMAAGIALGDRQALCEALRTDIAELQRFGTMYTDAELFTDRVFLYASANATRCYTGGFATRNQFHHTHAASWEGFGTDYAALVLRARPDHFKVLIYNFRDTPMAGKVRLWTLDHGRYQLTFGPDADGDDATDKATRTESVVIARATPVSLTLPPKQVVVLELRQVEKLEPIWERADLALSPLEVKFENGVVTGVAHNIGSKEVPEVVVALVDAAGKERARQKLGPLAAPLDLGPKRIPFRFEGLKPAAGWRVIVDPDGRIPEITEENNGVTLR